MKIPPLTIGDLTVPVPIIQGGMGVGVSLSRLAAAVANAGGVGVMAGVQMGFDEPDFATNSQAANERALRRHIRTARELSPQGVIGINVMTAINHYRETVKAAVEEKIDLIISGAGLPSELPGLVKGSATKIAPIVSSGKAAALIAKMWDRKHGVAPDLVIVEGPEAGGHLGFSREELTQTPPIKLETLVRDVLEAMKATEEKYRKKIPVIAAGGIFNGADIARFLKMGAAGVQMGTRFVATEECDAHPSFKEAYVKSVKETIDLVLSPVGMPGRAVINAFMEKTRQVRVPAERCSNCLKPCNPAETPYCISDALIRAVQGNLEEGLIFTGSNAWRIEGITTVKALMNTLISETESALAME
ncbi:NAD(P)H-dependent flavin oxidoreductase [Anoxynatronum buryatiense]|uniref:Probable nitronate monooxygenase n=1 Tax=Anoxynatronum buryatiense TaxID=489973 RepID=A0AA45WV40_9CLOT|nr:nitronate monooxygenase family protein [Anoxynatronum buryatiense]SMP51850.1 NAD(P)H-dependent flavin oxidoreductase YrpB, nitropropane dioxygenase family [Anoxynatronum buryatiense]